MYFLVIFVIFSYITYKLKISLVNYNPEVILLKLPILYERLLLLALFSCCQNSECREGMFNLRNSHKKSQGILFENQ